MLTAAEYEALSAEDRAAYVAECQAQQDFECAAEARNEAALYGERFDINAWEDEAW